MNAEKFEELLKSAERILAPLEYKPLIVFDDTLGLSLLVRLWPGKACLITLKEFNWSDITGELTLAKDQIIAILVGNGKKTSENSENRLPLSDTGS
jgi:hypothetical protein